jgi:hypothetical protein
MIRHVDWDAYRHRTASSDLPKDIEAIEIELDGGRVKISINGTQVFEELGTGTRSCTITIDRDVSDPHNWAPGCGADQEA